MPPTADDTARAFDLPGEPLRIEPLLSGHINASFVVATTGPHGPERFLLQRVNNSVFARPVDVMSNVVAVCAHLHQVLAEEGAPDIDRHAPTLVRTLDGRMFFTDDDGSLWRMFRFIESSRTIESVSTPAQAEAAGRAFGAFQRRMSSGSPPRLLETIPRFHDTPGRLEELRDAALTGEPGRMRRARTVLEPLLARSALAGSLLRAAADGLVPERIAHNDAKISNVLFDEALDDVLCVIDLDTVMPGLALYDFGDMVRSMTSVAAEDEPNPLLVEVDPERYRGLVTGYLAEAHAFLTENERRRLVTAGKVITFEQAVRFLTDYLQGDVYYRVSREHQNLDRARAQLALLESIEGTQRTLEQITRDAERAVG